MSYLLRHVELHEDWPGENGPIRPVTSRLERLFRDFERNKFLLLHGPANSGKETFALSLIQRWIQEREQKNDVKEQIVINCLNLRAGLAECSEAITPWEQNEKATLCLYCFLECQNALNSLSRLFRDLIDGSKVLKSVSVLLTATVSGHSEQRLPRIFEFARNKRFDFFWYADKEIVKEVLISGGKNIADLDSHFAEAFNAELGSADMTRVKEFIGSDEHSLHDWITHRNDRTRISRLRLPAEVTAPGPTVDLGAQLERTAEEDTISRRNGSTTINARVSSGLPPSESGLASLLKRTAEQELSLLDEVCRRRSGKSLQSIFVPRSFREISRPGESARRDEKGWADLLEDSSSFVLLGDAGSGKTVQLLQHARTQCVEAQEQLESDAPEEKVAFAFYTRAPELAAQLVNSRKSLIEAAVHLLQETGRIVDPLSPWVMAMLHQGRGTLLIDALDELSETCPQNGTHSPRHVLMEGLSAHLRGKSPCPLVMSARKLGYSLDEAVFLPHWELLPFTPRQLKLATAKWFPEKDWDKEFRRVVRNTPPFEETLCIPVLLMLAAQMYREAFAADKCVPTFTRRVDFYQRAMDRYVMDWIRRTEEAGKLPTHTEREQFLPFLEGVGWCLWSSDPNRSDFSGQEISDAIAESKVPPEFRRRDLLQDVCESGLVAKFDGPSARYEFLHRTLLEFLVASYLVREREKPGSAFDIWSHIEKRLASGASSVVIWMVAGRLQDPESLIESVKSWASLILASSPQDPSGSIRLGITETLVNCLFECRAGEISRDKLEFAWELSTRTLDRIQRRKGRDGNEWRELADWSLVYRVLHAVGKHEGVGVRADELISLISEIRRTHLETTKSSHADVIELLKAALKSVCPAVRWIAVWTSGASLEKKWRDVTIELADELVAVFHEDPDSRVRGIAARVLVHIQHPIAYQLLEKRLNADEPSAAIAMGALLTDEALSALKNRASSLLVDPPTDARNSMLNAVLGALEAIVDRRTRQAAITEDVSLNKILLAALNGPSPAMQASAASALGKLGVLEAWGPLTKLLEGPRTAQPENLRKSLCFACQQLAPRLPDQAERGRAADIFRRVLSNKDEPPGARRPAASALGQLAQHGAPTPQDVQLLLWGARDATVAKSCLFAISRMEAGVVFPDLLTLLKEDVQLRTLFCDVVRETPSRTGLQIMRWLLDNDRRPSLQCHALVALQNVGAKVRNRIDCERTDYEEDAELLGHLLQSCVSNLERQNEAVTVVACSLGTLKALVLLPPFQTGKALSSVIPNIRKLAREFLENDSVVLQVSAAYLLGHIGEEPDIQFLRRVEDATDNTKLRSTVHSAAQCLRRRLTPQRNN